jgi:hypothetical protein
MIHNADMLLKLKIGGFSIMTYYTCTTLTPLLGIIPFIGCISTFFILDAYYKYQIGHKIFENIVYKLDL